MQTAGAPFLPAGLDVPGRPQAAAAGTATITPGRRTAESGEYDEAGIPGKRAGDARPLRHGRAGWLGPVGDLVRRVLVPPSNMRYEARVPSPFGK